MIERIGTPGHETISTPNFNTLAVIRALRAAGNLTPLVAEIGVGIGASTLVMASLLENRGEIHLYDFESKVEELVGDLARIGFTNVRGFGNSHRHWDSYNWTLGRMLLDGKREIYDYIYIDGAHTFAVDALAFVLCDRLLKPGGYLEFDDYDWRFAGSQWLRDSRDQFLTDEQIHTPQVKMVVDLFLHDHAGYVAVQPNRLFRKVAATSERAGIAGRSAGAIACVTEGEGASREVWDAQAATRAFSSSDYWEARYAEGGHSGAGSRGDLVAFKAAFLDGFVRANAVGDVVDLGCGDGTLLSLIRPPRYLGLDVSATTLRRCAVRFADRPECRFLPLARAREAAPAELALSIDVIFHLVEDDVFAAHLDLLFGLATRFVVIYASNHDQAWPARHVRHRRFTDRGHVGWRLAAHLPNPYRFDPTQPDITSFADFFVYAREGAGCSVVLPPTALEARAPRWHSSEPGGAPPGASLVGASMPGSSMPVAS